MDPSPTVWKGLSSAENDVRSNIRVLTPRSRMPVYKKLDSM